MLEHDHGTPFEHNSLTFLVKCPIFVARQWFRHRIASFNEISGRYVEVKEEFYIPENFRKQSTDNPSYDTLKETLVSLKESCKKLKINKIAFPKYECGLDKLQWCKVKTIINEVLINAGIHCTVYLKTHKRDESEVDLSVTSNMKKLQRQDEFINN